MGTQCLRVEKPFTSSTPTGWWNPCAGNPSPMTGLRGVPWHVPPGFSGHSRRGDRHTEELVCPLPRHMQGSPEAASGAGSPSQFFPGSRSQGSLYPWAAPQPLCRPIPPASSLPRSDGGRRWQVSSPTCLTGRARVGAAPGTRCLSQPAGVLQGSPAAGAAAEVPPAPEPPCKDSSAPPRRGTRR